MARNTTPVFGRTISTQEKINAATLTLALSRVSGDKSIENLALRMVNSLYRKSQKRVIARANAVLAVLDSHNAQDYK